MSAVQPQLPGPAAPSVPVASAGLVPPLGPPQRVSAGARALVLVAGLALLALLSAWCGWEIGRKDLDRLHALPYVLPPVAVLGAVVLAWTGTVWKLRCDGRVLEGTGVLGREGIDLGTLSGVAAAANRGKVSLTLRTPQGRLTVDTGALGKAGPQVFDVVGRAVWDGQEQGRYVVPQLVAALWGMPVRSGAPKRGRSGATGVALAAVGALIAGLVVGIVLGMA